MIVNVAFQEADTIGITRPITKHNYLVTERRELADTIKKAFVIAGTGRPGPVVIDLPKDIIVGKYDDEYPAEIKIRGYNPVLKGHAGQIKRAAEMLEKAKKPLFYIGGGKAVEAFRKVVKKTGVPVISSLMGIGGIESDHPLFCGMLGMHGTYAANMAVTESDLLFGVGTRFDDRATGKLDAFAPHAKIIHVDIDPSAIARNVPVEIPIVGDAQSVLEDLLPIVKPPAIDSWVKQITAWKNEHPVKPEKSMGKLPPGLVVQKLAEVFPDAIVTTEVGQNQMWAALFFNFQQPRSLITSGGLGTMGYGFPAAIGAKMANPGKTVIDIAGDGSIQMNIQELATAVQEGITVIIAILNNGYLGMVRQWQTMFYDNRLISTRVFTPDFVKLAEAFGLVGLRVTDRAQVESAIQRAMSHPGPVLIDFQVEEMENIYPMVPPGASLSETIDQPKIEAPTPSLPRQKEQVRP
jgi:acetolactate synthase-1/2/3 large subunit